MKKFKDGDIFRNIIKTYPKVQFFANGGSVHYNKQNYPAAENKTSIERIGLFEEEAIHSIYDGKQVSIPIGPPAGYLDWYDARNVDGLNNISLIDDQSIATWKDLGPGGYDLTNSISTPQKPKFMINNGFECTSNSKPTGQAVAFLSDHSSWLQNTSFIWPTTTLLMGYVVYIAAAPFGGNAYSDIITGPSSIPESYVRNTREIGAYRGSTLDLPSPFAAFDDGAWLVVATLFNGVSSKTTVYNMLTNTTTEITGDAGSTVGGTGIIVGGGSARHKRRSS